MAFKTFYDFFKGYSKEKVIKAFNLLNEYHQCVVYMKYGQDLIHLNNIHIPYYIFYKVVEKVRYILENNQLEKGFTESEVLIYDLLKEYSKKEILEAITLLPLEEKKIINLKLENNLNNQNWNFRDAFILYFNIIPKLTLILKENKSKNKECTKTIYEIFKNYTQEEVDNVLFSLSKEEQDLLKSKYLENTWTNDKEIEFRDNLLPKLRSRLKANRENKNKKIPTIYLIFKQYSKELIDDVINNLDTNEKHLLFLRFGNDFENPVSLYWDNSYIKEYTDLLKKIKKLLKIKENNSNQPVQIFNYQITNKYLLKQLRFILNDIDKTNKDINYLKKLVIIILYQNMNNNYDLNDIALLVNLNKEEVLEIVNNNNEEKNVISNHHL